MKIHVPQWITQVKDDHFKVFLWFCERISRQDGYDTYYHIHTDDVVRICNKRNKGLFDWLTEQGKDLDHIKFGQPYDEKIMFSIKSKPKLKKPGRPHNEKLIVSEIEDQRAQLVYIYLLGCLNNNLLEGSEEMSRFSTNAFGQKEFYITREAHGYIKKKDRICEDEE